MATLNLTMKETDLIASERILQNCERKTLKTDQHSSLSKDFGFWDNLPCDIQRIPTIEIAYDVTHRNSRQKTRRQAPRRRHKTPSSSE